MDMSNVLSEFAFLTSSFNATRSSTTLMALPIDYSTAAYYLLASIAAYAIYRLVLWTFFYTSPIEVLHSFQSALLPTTNDAHKGMTVVDFMRKEVPAIFGPRAYFRPIWWLRGGHMQTMFCSIGDFSRVDPIKYERIHIRVPEGGIVALDIYPPPSEKPPFPDVHEDVLVVLHGLTGGSHESYVRAALYDLTKPKAEGGLGMRAVVMNFRGCAGSPVVTRRLYHAGDTTDLRSTVLYITNTLFPAPAGSTRANITLHGLGFSLGANALTKYVGEEGPNCPLSSAVAVANVWDFLRGNYHIQRGTFLNKWVYDGVLGGALQSLLRMHRGAFPDNPKPFSPAQMNEQRNHGSFNLPNLPLPVSEICHAKSMTLKRFDDAITGPTFGFTCAFDYYASISSTRFLDSVTIPLLALNAKDDPIVSHMNHPDVQVLGNPWVVFARTGGGGHMGWFELGLNRWFVRPTKQFFHGVQEAKLVKRQFPEAEPRGEDGFIRMKGKTSVAYKVVQEKEFENEVRFVRSGMGKSKLFEGW